jgi:hypothetical protein
LVRNRNRNKFNDGTPSVAPYLALVAALVSFAVALAAATLGVTFVTFVTFGLGRPMLNGCTAPVIIVLFPFELRSLAR